MDDAGYSKSVLRENRLARCRRAAVATMLARNSDELEESLTSEGVTWAFTRLQGGSYWHPLTWLSRMFDCQIFGLRPGPHHLMNLCFHTGNGVLLFLVLLR